MSEKTEMEIVNLDDNPELASKIERMRSAAVELAVVRYELVHALGTTTLAEASGAYVAVRCATQEDHDALNELTDAAVNRRADPMPRASFDANKEIMGIFFEWMFEVGSHNGYMLGLDAQEAASKADTYRDQVARQFFEGRQYIE